MFLHPASSNTVMPKCCPQLTIWTHFGIRLLTGVHRERRLGMVMKKRFTCSFVCLLLYREVISLKGWRDKEGCSRASGVHTAILTKEAVLSDWIWKSLYLVRYFRARWRQGQTGDVTLVDVTGVCHQVTHIPLSPCRHINTQVTASHKDKTLSPPKTNVKWTICGSEI